MIVNNVTPIIIQQRWVLTHPRKINTQVIHVSNPHARFKTQRGWKNNLKKSTLIKEVRWNNRQQGALQYLSKSNILFTFTQK